jgi:formamidopyrimidine-DNA glycosylase
MKIPEIVEVQVQVDGLQEIVGEMIHKVQVEDGGEVIIKHNEIFESFLEHSQIKQIFRIGKYIVFELYKEQTGQEQGTYFYMLVHLSMTGGFLINKLHPHERIVFDLGKVSLYYKDTRKFGSILLLDADQLNYYINSRNLGEDALNASKYEIEMKLIKDLYGPKNLDKDIKSLLLDQTIISGLGNIYANEALFMSGIHPEETPRNIGWNKMPVLAEHISTIVHVSYGHGGSSIRDYTDPHGKKGFFQNILYVYGRKGKPCKLCETPIEKISIDGRSTFFCPTCQGGK